MPTYEFLPPVKLMYKDSNDVWCEVAKVAHEIHFDPAPGEDFTATSTYFIHGDDAVELCGTLRLPSEIRKRMSRKRYKKLLMSFGFSRNDAEKISRVTLRILTPASRSIVITSLLFSGARKEMGIRNEQAP